MSDAIKKIATGISILLAYPDSHRLIKYHAHGNAKQHGNSQ